MTFPLIILLFYVCSSVEPTWSVYSPNVMYSGEYKAFLTTKSPGALATVTQTMYRTDVPTTSYFTTAPNVILSILGYKQNAPSSGLISVGFDVKISAIRTTAFDVLHNIYGASMTYLNYMYLAVSKTNTNYFMGYYTQSFDTTAVNKTYSVDVALNTGEYYSNYPTNTIEMKGFLAGYKMQQGTAIVMQLNFTLQTKNASFFTITVSVNSNSVLQNVWYYRIGYDRTAIQRATYKDVFRDFHFELINKVNVYSIYNLSVGSLTEFQYRNFLMGTNKINHGTTVPTGVQFFLYYYFAQSMAKVDTVFPYYIDNPALSNYLYGQVFYHAVVSCSSTAPYIYYMPDDRKCYSSCSLGYFTDTTTNTCIACHFTCRTCSQGYLINKCLTCDSNYRVFNSSTSTCDCPSGTFNDGVNLHCPVCHASCEECASSSSTSCKSCSSTLNRQLYDPTSVGIGLCKCSLNFYQSQANSLCQACSPGCLQCHFSGNTQICQSCNTTANLLLINNSCGCASNFFALPNLATDIQCNSTCPSGYFADTGSNTCITCHFTCKTCTEGSLANNCSSCDNNYRVFNASMSTCDCPSGTFSDGVNLQCSSCHASCVECTSSSLSSCKSCSSALHRQLYDPTSVGIGQCKCSLNFYQNQTNSLCQACSLGCLQCQFSGITQICQSCNITANLQLINTSCGCASGYYSLDNVCIQELCGDGILSVLEQCDDDNVQNGDGCSNQCKIEDKHACFTNLTISPYSICYYNDTIKMSIIDVTKALYSNEVTLKIKIDVQSINQQYLKTYLTDSSSIVVQDIARRLFEGQGRYLASASFAITSTNYDEVSKILTVTFTYNQSFDIKTKKIKFQPSQSSANSYTRYFFNSPEAILSLQSPTNKIDTIYYDQQQYSRALSLKYAFLSLLVIFWVCALVFIAIGKGNVGMEMMIVFQLAYASLLSQDNLQIELTGLAGYGKYTAGYNVQFIQNDAKCLSFITVNLSCNFINNLNISLFLMALVALIYGGLRLANKLLNHRAENNFVQSKQRRIAGHSIDATDLNIVPNMEHNERDSESRDSQLQSNPTPKIQKKAYEYQDFIPKRILNLLLDLEFFLTFVTVIIWALSITQIKQSTVAGIVEASLALCLYVLIWVFWFLHYFESDFSFIQVQKTQKNEEIHCQEMEAPKDQFNEDMNQERVQQTQPTIPKKSKFNASQLKVLFYPMVWVSLLGIGLLLSRAQGVKFVSESLILGGSIVFSIVSWITNVYKEKINLFRSVLNCIFLIFIQVAFIIAQMGTISDVGFPIAISILVLLSLTLLSNTFSTFYLYRLQRNSNKKSEEVNELENIQMEINRLYQLRRQKSLQNMIYAFSQNDASSQNSESEPQKTVKKAQNWGLLQVSYQNQNQSSRKFMDGINKMSKLQIDQTTNRQRASPSQQCVPVIKKYKMRSKLEAINRSQTKTAKNKFYYHNKSANNTQSNFKKPNSDLKFVEQENQSQKE